MPRTTGSKNLYYKYLICYYNKKDEKWDELGCFTSLKKASIKLNIDYNLLTDLYNGKRQIYNKFYKIIDVNKYGETTEEEKKNNFFNNIIYRNAENTKNDFR